MSPTTASNGNGAAKAPASAPARRGLDARQRTRLMFGISVGLTLTLYWIPYGAVFAYPLLLLSTLAHEMGHGLTAVLVGGNFQQFMMWSDGSGVATYRSVHHALGEGLIAAGGLVGPAIAASILFFSARKANHARRVFLALGVVLAMLLMLYVRNLFGFLFVGVLILLALLISRLATDEMAQLLLVFVAVQLALSVFSRGDYLFTEIAETSSGAMPSDVAQMANALFLPYWFWGSLCGAFSVWVLWRGFRAFWR